MKNVLILTALELEYTVVRSFLEQCEELILEDGTIAEKGISKYSPNTNIHLRACGKGNINAALSTDSLIKIVQPDLAVFIGIAGGIKDVLLGDIVIGEKIYGYENAKIGTEHFARPEIGNCSYEIIERAKAEARKDDWKTNLNGFSPSQTLSSNVIIGNIAAGEKVLISEDSELNENLKRHYNDTTAIEMEGIGFMKAVYKNGQIPTVVVRGISDLLTNKEVADRSGVQEIACRNAAAFAFKLIEKFQPKTPARITAKTRYQLKLDTEYDESDHAKIQAILAELAHYTQDNSLNLIRITKGSTILHLESSEATYESLKKLVESGVLQEKLGYQIELSSDDSLEIEKSPLSIELPKGRMKSELLSTIQTRIKNIISGKLHDLNADKLEYQEFLPSNFSQASGAIGMICGVYASGVFKPLKPSRIEIIEVEHNTGQSKCHVFITRNQENKSLKSWQEAFVHSNDSNQGFVTLPLNIENSPPLYESYIMPMSSIVHSMNEISSILSENEGAKHHITKTTAEDYIYALVINRKPQEWDNITSVRIAGLDT